MASLKQAGVIAMEKSGVRLAPIYTGNNSMQYRIIGGYKDGKTLRLRTSGNRVLITTDPLGDIDNNAVTDYWLLSMPCADNLNQAEIFLIPSKEILKVIKDNHLKWLKENPHKNSRFGLLNFNGPTAREFEGYRLNIRVSLLESSSDPAATGSERSRRGRMPALYSFIKYPPGVRDLPKQARQILEILEAKKQCTKEELLAAMEGKVVTVQNQERILSYYQTRLIDSGLMEVRRGVPGEVVPEAKVKKSMSIKEVIDRATRDIAAISGIEESQVRLTLTLQ